ncbi:PHF14 [Cordylochernes scorpioides]|uniref:PHF14 n=1 Tax=Cordylochernes scorpioides TaxID=51811 RepID=A0ABY6L0T3_9ARAC|nr:PHF14 [Cordylochernes scorpioides]
MERDPSKRRVKTIENYQQILDIVDLEDDSSDDSDFKIDDNGDQEESENDDSASSSDGSGDGSDEEANGEPASPEENSKPSLGKIPPNATAIRDRDSKECVSDLIEKAKQAKQRGGGGGAVSKFKVLICSVCLSDASGENDEIVECDCCGVSVHESCYGISDSDSVVSTTSSCSTEPWFCDACKAGNPKPHCELCPNFGGIFKETDVGKWVHLVCALYIPGVAFGDVDKLSPVTLFEMPYTRWGAKACMLCEDERYSCTGVCISCDAGMCRSNFHITCAQREGLLSQASTIEDIADPFFAYCKIHVDKSVMKCKRQNWLALQSQAKLRNLEDQPQSEEKSRIEKKLAWHRSKYLETKVTKPLPWVPTQKMPRMLTTSPSACKMLLRKAELLGISSQTHISANDALMDVRKNGTYPLPSTWNL